MNIREEMHFAFKTFKKKPVYLTVFKKDNIVSQVEPRDWPAMVDRLVRVCASEI